MCDGGARIRIGSKMARMSTADRIDVSIEHKRSEPSGDGDAKHPNTCPGCGSHYRDDELAQHLRVCPHCGHHFAVRALERDRPSSPTRDRFVEDEAELRSADPLAFFDLRPYPERLAEAELATGLGDAMVTGRATIEEQPCRLAVMDFSFMGGSMGSVVGEKFVARLRPRGRGRRAARLGLGVRRRAHAGGDPRADAAAEDRVRGRGPPRRGRRPHLRPHAPDDGRPARELRLARRRPARRAGRADVVRRPASRRADDAREAARRLRPRRVEPPLRAHRRDRPARRAARDARPPRSRLFGGVRDD